MLIQFCKWISTPLTQYYSERAVTKYCKCDEVSGFSKQKEEKVSISLLSLLREKLSG